MNRIFTLLFVLLTCNAFSQIDTATAVFDFNNLTVAPLNGQDGWITNKYNTAVDIAVRDTGYDNTNALYFNQSGPSVGADASRSIDTLFGGTGFSNFASTYVITFEVAKNWWGIDFGIGADLNNDGMITKANTNEIALKMNISNNTGEKLTLPNGALINLSASTITTAWTTIEITLYNLSNTSTGKISIRAKELGLSTWSTIVNNYSLNIDTNAVDKRNPSLWDMIYIHFEGATARLDNIRINKYTPVIAAGISESANGSFNVYPNPFNDKLYIESTEAVNGATDVSVRNINGSLVFTDSYISEMSKEIDMSALTPGVYFLEVKNAKGIYNRKLVKK